MSSFMRVIVSQNIYKIQSRGTKQIQEPFAPKVLQITWKHLGNLGLDLERKMLTCFSEFLPCIPSSLFLKSILLIAISLDAKKSLFSSDNIFRCSRAPKSSNPRVIRSADPAGITSPQRNFSSWRSEVVKPLESSNKTDL